MYHGEAHTSIDEKGRLNVPKEFRQEMDHEDHDTWFLTRGFDGYVFLFEKQDWLKLVEVLENPPDAGPLNPRLLDFQRFFIGGATKVKRDSAGRLLLPAYLREYADIDRDAVLLGVRDHLELWNKERWRTFQQANMKSFKEMASELFGGKLFSGAATGGGMRDAES